MPNITFDNNIRDSLGNNAVHVWVIRFEDMKAAADRWVDILTDNEVGRAGRFYRTIDGLKFAGTRVILRRLLGRYTTTQPKDVILRISPLGKPMVETGGHSSINFSVSRSGDFAVMAFSRTKRIGIDIEFVDESILSFRNTRDAARMFGLPVSRMASPAAGPSFYNGWTRREAYLKALGIGLFNESAKTLCSVDENVWLVKPLAIAPGYAGAVAVERPVGKIYQGRIGLFN